MRSRRKMIRHMKMKPSLLIAFAVAAAGALAGAGIWVADRPTEAPREAAGDRMRGDGVARPSTTEKTLSSPAGGRLRNQRVAGRDSAPESELGIPAADLLAARGLADEMAAAMEQNLAMLEDGAYRGRSAAPGDPSPALGLRLGVGPGIIEKLGEILAADREAEIERRIAMEKSRMEHAQVLLADDRESYINFLAIESLVSRGAPLSEVQADFHRRFREKRDAGFREDAASGSGEWYDKPKVIEAMRRHLSAEERVELETYVDEQKGRERERQRVHAYMRSGAIADRLGLDEAERTKLFEYLEANPHAAGPELREVLSPELRELLPPGL